MLKILKYAAIDIGSNAVRLLISSVIEEANKPPRFKKTSLVRVPIRLGADVFLNDEISKENTKRMLDTMLAFKLLMKTHRVDKYKACATSAMREASNGEKVADLIQESTGITIDIIGGEEEATIIAATDLSSFIDKNKTYLYVDVGGGSTEFSVIYNGEKTISKSFKVGTVRLLNDIVKKDTWLELEQWVKTATKHYDTIEVIGSGGNINNIFKSSGKALGKPLTYFYLTSYYNMLQSYSYEERITQLNLNPDRADVIIPATRIYLSAMKWSGAKDIYVPKIGLADGIIKSMYKETILSHTKLK
ncbi:Ppx/GppA phosphatase family protein [Lacinutrix jangbogonensis]|uniref:Ppx/GppA phosphatase family protein n=1 Tax=Lacinutrix jangbogonensis TaxID=1469557 RepID=UPI00053D8D2D|nr:exopolyphosphatase [Lacinutrix jangbogonensis]